MTSDPQRYQQAKAIFHAALERTGDARDAFVHEACGDDDALATEVRSLLRASDAAATDFLASGPPVARHAIADLGALGADRGYRVIRELARGGMGVVYLAERADGSYAQQVAIKLLSHSALLQPEALLRLKLEREILARLNHPNIARLLDGGTTADGLPYLVMEYVDGERLDVWCKTRAPATDARIDLFLAVCDAVAYAHRNLVVHRDLKPANVLVTADGAPKLLDFGIAKLLDDGASALTEEGARPMTPRYASPEQILGKPVTTLSDVYSLGVMLYELLTGTTPYGEAISTPLSLPQAICERDPPAPSTQKGSLRGDLDAITMRALRKAPEARYASVEALAEDLRAYRDGLPVAARRGERWYRARRFAARHWRALATAAALVALVAGFVARLDAELARTAIERDKAERVVAFFGELFQVADPSEARGNTITVREVLERGARALERDASLEPGVRATMLEIVGTVYRRLGLLKPAEPLLARSLELRDAGDPAGRVHALSALAALRVDQGQYAPAQALLDEAESLRSGLLAGDRELEARLAHERGVLALRKAELPAAEKLLDRALALRPAARDPRGRAETLAALGNLARDRGQFDDAARRYDDALALLRARKLDAWGQAKLENNLGMLAGDRGDAKAAAAHLTESLERMREVLGERHALIATLLSNLGSIEMLGGDYASASAKFEQALAMRRELLGAEHPLTGTAAANLGYVRYVQGDLAGAQALYDEALALQLKGFGPKHPHTLSTRRNLAALALARGEADAAAKRYAEVRDDATAALGPDHEIALQARARLASIRGDAAELAAIAARVEEKLGAHHALLPEVLALLAKAQSASDPAAACASSARADTLYAARLPEADWQRKPLRDLLAACR